MKKEKKTPFTSIENTCNVAKHFVKLASET